MDEQIQLSLLDMLFINYAVEPDRLRPFVPAELTLDTFADGEGRPIGFVSAVAFRVADVRSGVLPLPSLSFEQINFRAYVVGNDGPAVYFFAMKINSRLVSSMTSFLKMPVSYDKIEIVTAPVLPSLAASNVEL